MGGGQLMAKNEEDIIASLYDQASTSVAAESVMTAIGPQLERRIDIAMGHLFQAAPELGPLLDARAKLRAIYDMRKKLKEQINSGAPAVKALNEMMKGD